MYSSVKSGTIVFDACADADKDDRTIIQINNTLFILLSISVIEYLHKKSSLFSPCTAWQKGMKKRTKETPKSPLFMGYMARLTRA
ncbi:hypothetical protein HMPREF9145_2663 [Segatella salivae F0493]|uniref:Uncharacterized protein n=1 Tax=Segatella salivae F0493 TaxID=1395125 RepID=U2LF68_9BACT|nr:hypothetical protein HMPREF9145_2663 [Segatella salivae F0493]